MKIIGHRGARGLVAENTLDSLKVAIEHGVDGIEFDIHVTSDNVAVLCHDPVIAAADGSQLDVRASSYDELVLQQPALCTLREAMVLIGRRARALIEVKTPDAVPAIIQVIKELQAAGWTAQDMCFLSFDYRTLKTLHASLPDVPIMVNEKWSSIRAVRRARQLDTKEIDIYYRWLWPGVIRHLARRGYQLNTFTLNDAAKAKRWQKYGLYAVITDYPDRMSQLKEP